MSHPSSVPPIEIGGYNIGHPYGISRDVGADLCVCPLKCIMPLSLVGERGIIFLWRRFHPATSWHPSRGEPDRLDLFSIGLTPYAGIVRPFRACGFSSETPKGVSTI